MKEISNTKKYFSFLQLNTCAIKPFKKFSDFPGLSTVFILFILLFVISCKKDSPENVVHPLKQLVTAKGQTTGAAITKIIGSTGGSVSSADGKLTLVIPAGALPGDKEISVQKVSTRLPGGHSDFYRLTPYDIAFQKPVAISLRYEEDSVKGTVPELIGLIYQNQDGKWFRTAKSVLDKQAHTITASTNHFSDWGYFPYLYIDPSQEVVDPNAQMDLRVMATVPDEYLEMPMPDDLPLNEPFLASASICGPWSYSGKGSISGNSNKAHYQAPNSVPNANPESVSVSIKMNRQGQFLLVSNIYIRSDLHIHYMQVDETDINAGGMNYPSRLWIYGSFGSDPGTGKRFVKINNTPVTVAVWTPALITCDIPASGPYSSGMVEVQTGNKTTSKMLNEWTVELEYAEKQSPDGSLTKKANLVLHLRGDAEGYIGNGQTKIVLETSLNLLSKGIINITGSSFTTQVTMDACGTYIVNWDPVHDLQLNRKKSSEQGDGLYGSVVNNPDGFDVKLYFKATDAIITHRKFTDCQGSSILNHVRETIDLQGFKEVIIPLRFNKSGSNAAILAGAMPDKPGNPASGLYWDPPSYPATLFKVSLKWDTANPKFN